MPKQPKNLKKKCKEGAYNDSNEPYEHQHSQYILINALGHKYIPINANSW